MLKNILIFCLLVICACGSKKAMENSAMGNTRTVKVKMLNPLTYLLSEYSKDNTYAYSPSNPVKVGNLSPENERKYMNALLGPKGEKTRYRRLGSCCAFETPNGMIENAGSLDIYELLYSGGSDTFKIYINMYDRGDLFIPIGLSAKKTR